MTILIPERLLIAACAALSLAACGHAAPPGGATPGGATPGVATPFAPTAGIIDIMKYEIDPSADALWDSVGTYVTQAGTENRQPRTPAQWSEARGHALILTEAANLLMMAGRRVATVAPAQEPATPGDLTPAQAQAAIDRNRAAFLSFARGLRDVGGQLVQATDRQDAAALLELGGVLDEVCENCHLQFWYPRPGGGAK